ncbi:unnamed protein product [Caenorhabditis auriculariae]|uniref:Uncharacterized protein n=1 Tax=Caenorhabditis auriculariae TaxID=2777116 RepID=A0A8S1HZJ8_9PELO|nr:unnamed protein product [Caenorhabditis auriculariae]
MKIKRKEKAEPKPRLFLATAPESCQSGRLAAALDDGSPAHFCHISRGVSATVYTRRWGAPRQLEEKSGGGGEERLIIPPVIPRTIRTDPHTHKHTLPDAESNKKT